MSKCLRCGAGSEWIEGKVPAKPRDDEIFDLRNEVEHLRTIITELRIILDNDWELHNPGDKPPDWEMVAMSGDAMKKGQCQPLDVVISELKAGEKDWEGREVQPNESPDHLIRVWCVSPHDNSSYDYCVIGSWQSVCDYIHTTAESHLDGMELAGEECPTRDNPFVIKVWLEQMTKSDFEEIITLEDY